MGVKFIETVILKILTGKKFKKSAIKIIVLLLEHFAEKSSNTLDDEIVKMVKEALYDPSI